MTYDEAMSRAVKAQMAVAGVGTLEALASKADMLPQTLGRFLLNGGNLKTLRKIAGALGVTSGKLLTDAEAIRRGDTTEEVTNG